MQSRTHTGRRARNAAVLALIVAAVWAGAALTRGAAAQADPSAPTGPLAHFSRVVELVRG
ncbi:hypothetical protein K2224_06130 [Streptomyces sp. BHT-5-2]|uniref:hypothetical protein n=1 Tax=unclassified Streptomyces TaxID=2593676 RepID=UPI001C8CF8CC|nr:hypothetical protein [Streptomyces sp. BHT-5-2]QZL02846.1 hypothetical protein K2224_06130 [Streptomyces sp. BHT-5-2]